MTPKSFIGLEDGIFFIERFLTCACVEYASWPGAGERPLCSIPSVTLIFGQEEVLFPQERFCA